MPTDAVSGFNRGTGLLVAAIFLALFAACGGSGETQTTTTQATPPQAPSPTQAAASELTLDKEIPCLPGEILLHLRQEIGEPHAVVHGRTCAR
jgi:hypothetical protein